MFLTMRKVFQLSFEAEGFKERVLELEVTHVLEEHVVQTGWDEVLCHMVDYSGLSVSRESILKRR